MSFKMPKRADGFFKSMRRITGGSKQFGLAFDRYYMCAMVGMAARKIGQDNEVGQEFLQGGYPAKYQDHADIVAGLLVEADMARQGIPKDNRDQMQRLMVQLLKLDSPSRLSPEGHKLLDKYAAGGLSTLEQSLVAPQTEEEFSIAFLDLLKELCEPANRVEAAGQPALVT